MRFRNTKVFNMALLGKQGWSIMNAGMRFRNTKFFNMALLEPHECW